MTSGSTVGLICARFMLLDIVFGSLATQLWDREL